MSLKFTSQEKIEILEAALSWLVVFAMFIYGFGKIIQFNGATEIDKTVSDFSGMELMWAFYGYSKPFTFVLGFIEVLSGVLILIKRTRLLGCFLASTILVNIILQDVFYQVHTGALIAAIIYQITVLIILWINREKLVSAFKILTSFPQPKQSKKRIFIKLFIAFILFAIFRVLEYYICFSF